MCAVTNTGIRVDVAVGFIEFIVDPSFHVMSDAIGALTASLQQQCRHDDDDVIVTSPQTAEPSPPPTPPSSGASRRYSL